MATNGFSEGEYSLKHEKRAPDLCGRSFRFLRLFTEQRSDMAAKKTSSRAKKALEPIAAPTVPHRFPVVGIGASAGGLEAASSFFKELGSHLGMAYVLVLHLDPARESKVSEILARTTTIPVLQAKDGMPVQPDHIYVIPPNCEMTIDHWVLHLRDREAHRSANTTIDTFLRSLAVAHGSDAIGVILSGTASDGTLGLAAVKGEAGITFAQEPSLRQIRRHAGERDRLWLCRLHPDPHRHR